jgi:hypothetical protein|tara:strand:+ start:6514 stop:7026 length:513 start_codon:yes stop_codon:yes gene_type:complete
MEASQSLIELVTVAQSRAKADENRIVEILNLMREQDNSDAHVEELRKATVALELNAVNTFSLFEARMQHHFRRGPFSRKLKSLLLEAKKTNLANRVHQYYLAINVLKHGKGASYRELLNDPRSLFVVKPAEGIIPHDDDATSGLIDVTLSGFFDGLTSTILDAYYFLEKK